MFIVVMHLQYHLKSYAHRPWFSRGGHADSAHGLPVCRREERNEAQDKTETKLREACVLQRTIDNL